MAFPFFIARRYLFSKKSHNAINIISGISAAGVAFAAAALLCVLGVFNGFRDLIGGLYTNFDPQLEVRPVEGKFADAQDPILTEICKQKEVQAASYGLDELAMVPFQGRPVMVHVKGVDENFNLSIGTEWEISSNFALMDGWYLNPTLALKWSF